MSVTWLNGRPCLALIGTATTYTNFQGDARSPLDLLQTGTVLP